MAGNRDVFALLEEMLDSGRTSEEVCRDCPELLPEVRQRWKAFRLVDESLAELFPDPETHLGVDANPAIPRTAELPQVPGYRVEAVLGHGGMGIVYRAWHLRLNRAVALKMLLASPCARPEELERFQREAQAVAALRHANIVQVYDVGDVEGRPYFTMELVEGGNLAEKIQGVPQPARHAAALVATLADAIHVAHQSGIVHRDLKPGNILLTEDGTPKVTDFGLAVRLQGERALTLSGVPIGTPSYMSPCQARGDKTALGPATDIYALGAILYELLTGRPPFRAESAVATLQQVVAGEPVPPARLNPGVPRDLQTLCLKCLAKEPKRRYASAQGLTEDLGRFLRGEPVTARPVGAAERAWKWMRRRPALAGMLVAVALHVVGLSVGAWLLYRQHVIAQAHLAQTDRKVGEFLGRARDLLEVGWPAADLTRVTEANALARRADDLAHSDGASATVWKEAEAVRDHAAERLQRLENDRALVDALQHVMAENQPFEQIFNAANWSIDVANLSADDEYARAFRSWGLDVNGTPEAEAAARLSAEPDAVVQEVTAALDSWMLLRLRNRPGADWRRLFRLAERLDGNQRRRRLRALVVSGAPPRAIDVAGLVGHASPWLVPWEVIQGSSRRALLELRKEIDVRSEPAPTLVLFGYCCVDVGDLAGGEEVLRRAVAARPHEVLLLVALAKLLERQGPSRSAEAVGYFRVAYSQTLHLGPALSNALLLAGKPVEAEELLRELVRQPPFDRHAGVHLYLGCVQLVQQRYSDAEASFRESFRLRPDSAWALTNLAAALALQQKYGPAEVACRKAIALDHAPPQAHTNLGAVLVEQARYEEAEAASRKAIALRPDAAKAWSGLGAALFHQGKHGEAETAFRKALDLDPSQFIAHYNFGTALVAQGRPREAEAAFRAAIALNPEDGDVHVNLGGSLLDQKKYAAAEVAFRKAITLKPDDGRAYRNLGYALLRQAQFEEAAAALRKAAALLPASSPVGRHARQLEQQCEQYVALDSRFAAILGRTDQPANVAEQFHFARLCLFKKYHIAAAKVYVAAFAANSKLTEDLPGVRYEAATAAALAGLGQGMDSATWDDKERARWRSQALTWLRQDLAAWDRVLHQANANGAGRVRLEMQHWQADDCLTGLREPDALVKLPPDERAEWLALWKEVADLLRRAQTTS